MSVSGRLCGKPECAADPYDILRQWRAKRYSWHLYPGIICQQNRFIVHSGARNGLFLRAAEKKLDEKRFIHYNCMVLYFHL